MNCEKNGFEYWSENNNLITLRDRISEMSKAWKQRCDVYKTIEKCFSSEAGLKNKIIKTFMYNLQNLRYYSTELPNKIIWKLINILRWPTDDDIVEDGKKTILVKMKTKMTTNETNVQKNRQDLQKKRC